MCYLVPFAGAVVTSFTWRKNKKVSSWWLTLMFYGGALFGVIDHLWNGELFLISENVISDLLLGVVISGGILITWKVILFLGKFDPTLANYVDIKK